MNFLSGYKTYAGGAALICTGLGVVLTCVKTNDYSALAEAFATIGAGMAVFGFRSAMNK